MKSVQIKAFARISGHHPDPDYTAFFGPLEARRLSSVCKRAVAVSEQALQKTGTPCPDAIMTGTGLGCIDHSVRFLQAMLDDTAMKPTYFMMSTHNTIGSLIARRLGCHGYNATYSHGIHSFASALLDAFLQLREGTIRNALVLACEESSPAWEPVYAGSGAFGGRSGDMAAAFFLDTDPSGALCVLDDVSLSGPSRTDDTVLDTADALPRYGSSLGLSALVTADAVDRLQKGQAASFSIQQEKAHIRLCGK